MEPKFFICEVCGNQVEMVVNTGVPLMCCGKKMQELVPGTSDGAVEKHLPVYTQEGNRVEVTVGSTQHPMTAEHSIEWVVLWSEQGVQRKYLKPDSEPKTCFTLCDGDKVKAVYAYCNLHGLWKA